MFKKKKNKQKESKEIELPVKKDDKKKPDVPIHIKEVDEYAVLEPFDMWEKEKKTSIEQKPKMLREVIQIKKKKETKKEVKPKEKKEKPKVEAKKEEQKPVQTKPKLIIQKAKLKEIKPEKPVVKAQPKPPEKTPEPEPASKIPLDHIETDIDKVLKIIDEKKIVDLEYLSKKLKISVDTLEAWAKLLEERELIEIDYPIIGLPKLRKKKWKKKS